MFLGFMTDFAGDYAPYGWKLCHGQILNISEYPDLHAVIGNKYGGDFNAGTFALPDKRGRFSVCAGQGSGLSNYNLAAKGGEESVTLTIAQIPEHNHEINAISAVGTSTDPENKKIADAGAFDTEFSAGTPDIKMANDMVSNNGGGQAHNNMPPYLAVNCIICVRGAYPQKRASC